MTQLCPTCGKDNRDSARVCGHCQAPLQGLLGAHAVLQGRYEITALLGCGMGAVYLALDHRLAQNQVASTGKATSRQSRTCALAGQGQTRSLSCATD